MRAALVGSGGPVQGQEYPLDADTVTIGRRDGNTIVVKDPTVSRQHAEIRREGREFVLRDLGSADGVRVNGAPIAGDYRLRDGDAIAIGASAAFTAQLPPPASDAGVPHPGQPTAPDGPSPDATPGLMPAPEMSEQTRLGIVFSGPAPQLGSEAMFQAPEAPAQPTPIPAAHRSRRGLLLGLLALLLVVLVIALVAVTLVVARQ